MNNVVDHALHIVKAMSKCCTFFKLLEIIKICKGFSISWSVMTSQICGNSMPHCELKSCVKFHTFQTEHADQLQIFTNKLDNGFVRFYEI